MWRTLAIGSVLTLAAAAGIIAMAPPSESAPSKQERCEAWMRQYLTARLHAQPEPPPMNSCATLTDAQWEAVNQDLDPLRNEVVAARA